VKLVWDQLLPAKSGLAVEVKQGQHLRVTDLEGKQVVDMAVFNAHNLRDKLSPSYSRTRRTPTNDKQYRALDRLTEGDVLRSTTCTPLMTIVKETAEPKGIHDTYIRMCNRLFYESLGGEARDGCFETISGVVAPYGILPEDLPDPFNVFMNLQHDCEGQRWVVKEPVTRPGDYIEFRAENDCLVAFSNCADDKITPVNAYHCTPVQIQIFAE
jgi:uncharacterized protein